jgi:hypothetical protein
MQAARQGYAERVRAAFNEASNKSALIAFACGANAARGMQIKHRALGILIDAALTFGPFLDEKLRTGRAIFLSMLHAAETGGFSVPVIASQVPSRTEQSTLYGAELLVLCNGAEGALNRMQREWALLTLGARPVCHIRGFLAVVQCGWLLRLGTRMWERAIMSRARIFLHPSDHPASIWQRLSATTLALTWTSCVAHAMRTKFPARIPDIICPNVTSSDALAVARGCNLKRRALLRSYKFAHVRPALTEYDQNAFSAVAAKSLGSLRWSFLRLQPATQPFPYELLHDYGAFFWKWYRMWAITRISGAWPAPIFGDADVFDILPCCPLCEAMDVSIVHPLCVCPGTEELYNELAASVTVPSRSSSNLLMFVLFTHDPPPQCRRDIIEYVGRALSLSMSAQFGSDEDQEYVAATAEPHDNLLSSIDALLETAEWNAWHELEPS